MFKILLEDEKKKIGTVCVVFIILCIWLFLSIKYDIHVPEFTTTENMNVLSIVLFVLCLIIGWYYYIKERKKYQLILMILASFFFLLYFYIKN